MDSYGLDAADVVFIPNMWAQTAPKNRHAPKAGTQNLTLDILSFFSQTRLKYVRGLSVAGVVICQTGGRQLLSIKPYCEVPELAVSDAEEPQQIEEIESQRKNDNLVCNDSTFSTKFMSVSDTKHKILPFFAWPFFSQVFLSSHAALFCKPLHLGSSFDIFGSLLSILQKLFLCRCGCNDDFFRQLGA